MTDVKFFPFTSRVDVQFWGIFGRKKVDELKLNTDAVSVVGSYTLPRAPEGVLPAIVLLDAEAFESKPRLPPAHVGVPGKILNTNTLDSFRRLDKIDLLQKAGEEIWADIKSERALTDPSLLNRFLLICYADIKKHQYIYWFAFPSIISEFSFRISNSTTLKQEFSKDQAEKLSNSFSEFLKTQKSFPGFFKIQRFKDEFSVVSLSKTEPSECLEVFYGFIDPSSKPNCPGWPLRNFLNLIGSKFNTASVRVICVRDNALTHPDTAILTLDITPNKGNEIYKSVGWEKNAKGNMGPRFVDVSKQMDPKQLMSASIDLNLKLMKWNVLPSLNLEKISGTRCLLLGAGTLGCAVSRNLMAWGVRNITFIDNGRVSYSNPARQSLYVFDDCAGSVEKASAAAAALKKIFPDINSVGINLSIPMPGHVVSTTEVERYSILLEVKASFQALHRLIRESDVVFMLLDTRESRWLPTLLSTFEKKIVINCALGFDNYVVMRHGISGSKGQLSCYFCSDVVAPQDSLTERTLDQQCTVTRPGLAHIAGAVGTELLINILMNSKGANASSSETSGRLGRVPHQVRGDLREFGQVMLEGAASDMCTACSTKVINEFEARGFEFILESLSTPEYLEKLTGLYEIKKTVDLRLEEDDFVWDSD